MICRSFVDNCEFKDQSFKGLDTEAMVEEFFARKAAAQNEFAQLNLFIYVILRDSKLMELRPKLEMSQAVGGVASRFKDRAV